MKPVLFSQMSQNSTDIKPNPKLESAAHEFEASLMKEFLKPLQEDSLFSDDSDGNGDSSAGSSDALMGFGAEAMAKGISEHGGFGIARQILAHFQESGKPASTAKRS
ncbi:MAG TPA: hypothetical protein VHT24_10610 [Pseudacidobacterium sp.]|jgi:Rod binding domain-containing protein|nr:hypothetical protein [Pseudacidobacterium sp.]